MTTTATFRHRVGLAIVALATAVAVPGPAAHAAAAHANRPAKPDAPSRTAKSHPAKRSGKRGSPVAHAALFGYDFALQRGRCKPRPVSDSWSLGREFTANPPTVYPAVGTGQWVSWRFYLVDSHTNNRFYTSDWSPASWATSASPAPFSGPMSIASSGLYAQRMGVEVIWYSPTSGWSGAYYRFPVELYVTVNIGYGPMTQVEESC
jgi:hypothetical protein